MTDTGLTLTRTEVLTIRAIRRFAGFRLVCETPLERRWPVFGWQMVIRREVDGSLFATEYAERWRGLRPPALTFTPGAHDGVFFRRVRAVERTVTAYEPINDAEQEG